MGDLLFGTTLLASFLGGVVALLAPCCVSVMLPAYLSTGFRHRGGLHCDPGVRGRGRDAGRVETQPAHAGGTA
ncbi:MAG: hypothetical protein ACRDTE_30995 [Pseudonocardiaceae bacterium]